jgi:hypothetical protein
MGEAFGMCVEDIEGHVVRLIQAGDIKARVDSRNKVCSSFSMFVHAKAVSDFASQRPGSSSCNVLESNTDWQSNPRNKSKTLASHEIVRVFSLVERIICLRFDIRIQADLVVKAPKGPRHDPVFHEIMME